MNTIVKQSISLMGLPDSIFLNSCAGSVIRTLRINKGMTGYELGRITGYSQQQVSRYERGHCTLSLLTLFKLSIAFDMRLSELINEIEIEIKFESENEKKFLANLIIE